MRTVRVGRGVDLDLPPAAVAHPPICFQLRHRSACSAQAPLRNFCRMAAHQHRPPQPSVNRAAEQQPGSVDDGHSAQSRSSSGSSVLRISNTAATVPFNGRARSPPITSLSPAAQACASSSSATVAPVARIASAFAASRSPRISVISCSFAGCRVVAPTCLGFPPMAPRRPPPEHWPWSSAQPAGEASAQCASSTGSCAWVRTCRVTPPSTSSRRRERP